MAIPSLPPRLSDAEQLIATARELIHASRRQIAASLPLIARGTTVGGPSHPIVRRLRARRDATRRAQLLGGLTATARAVLAEADHLLEAACSRGNPAGSPRAEGRRPM